MNTPHKVTVAEIQSFIRDTWIVSASATTADNTQRKRLYVHAEGDQFQVRRRYVVVPNLKGWETVLNTEDLDEAVRLYNGLG